MDDTCATAAAIAAVADDAAAVATSVFVATAAFAPYMQCKVSCLFWPPCFGFYVNRR